MHKTARNLTVLGFGLSASAVVGWLLLRERKREKESSGITVKSRSRDTNLDAMPPIVLPLGTLDGSEESPREDTLTQINDVGPRFAAALRAIGITRFEQLAQQTPAALAEQLAQHVTVRPERIRTKDWIGQAAQLARKSS
jgi:hypothetical protein